MKKLICNVLAYLFLINPVMASTGEAVSTTGVLNQDSMPMSTTELKQKFLAEGLTAEEASEISNYIDFAVANKIDPTQANKELTAMMNNISYTGASFDGDVFLYTGLVLLLVGVIIAAGGSSSSSSSSYWTCYADSASYSAVGTGSSKSIAMDNALSYCAANSYYWETCYSYPSDCH